MWFGTFVLKLSGNSHAASRGQDFRPAFYVDERMDEWVDRWMDGWRDRCVGGWMGKYIQTWSFQLNHLKSCLDVLIKYS